MTNDKKPTVDKLDTIDSDCLEAFDHVYAYINNEIKDEKTLAMVEHHLGHCKSCYSRARMEQKINDRLESSREREVSDELKSRLHKLIKDF